MRESCVIGVDLGGTNVRAQAYFVDGNPAGERFENPSDAQSGTQVIFDALIQTIRQAAEAAAAPVSCVGIAVPGHIDDANGIVRWAPNFGESRDGVFYSWRDVFFKKPLEDALGLRIVTGNDANLAALGEYRYGVGRNSASTLVMLTLGTGIGGGVVMSPQSLQGRVEGPVVLLGGNLGGAELGHIILNHGGIDANSGEYGAVEGYCQRDAIIKRAVHKLIRGRDSIIRERVANNLSLITPLVLFEAATAGDEVAIEVFTEIGEWLGVAIGSLVNVFAPDLFVIGGQVSKAGEFLLGPARRIARNVAIPSLWEDCVVVQAEKLEDAGILGGVALAAQA